MWKENIRNVFYKANGGIYLWRLIVSKNHFVKYMLQNSFFLMYLHYTIFCSLSCCSSKIFLEKRVSRKCCIFNFRQWNKYIVYVICKLGLLSDNEDWSIFHPICLLQLPFLAKINVCVNESQNIFLKQVIKRTYHVEYFRKCWVSKN